MTTRRIIVHWAITACLVFGGLETRAAAADEVETPSPGKRVLIISVDGLRPDLLLRAKTPNIDKLIETGSFTFWAQTTPLGITLPSHTSMLTGGRIERHGIHWNGANPPRGVKYKHPHMPTLFELARQAGYTTALIAGKTKFNTLAKPGTVDQVSVSDKTETDEWVAAEAKQIISKHQPQVAFVHFPRVDSTGHKHGWASEEQMQAIGAADAAIGVVLDELKKLELFDNTLIILSADHGGFLKGHHGRDARGLHIPWIIHGPGVRHGRDLTRDRPVQVHTEDTFATACQYLGIALTHEIDGKPVTQAFDPDDPKEQPVAAQRIFNAQMLHLRNGGSREWDEFDHDADDTQLVVTFTASKNTTEQTLRLRHRDVKQAWSITLNDQRIGNLVRDENDQVAYFTLKPGQLNDGKNVLRIASASQTADDVMIGDVRLDNRPLKQVLNEGKVNVVITDADGNAMPSRVTIADENGSLVPVGAESNDRYAVRPGMIYTLDGSATFGVPAGTYTVYATRGFEYGLDSKTITVKPGEQADVRLRIRREVPTPGLVACDTHIHTFTYSRHGDATIQERMLTLPGEGVELPIATDHNLHIDYETTAKQMNVRQYFTPVIGNEMTTSVGHFNVFPVRRGAKPPDWRVPKWSTIFRNIHDTPGVRVIILNHPRNVHAGFQPMNAKHQLAVVGENLDGWKLEANAMELVNSAALQSDPLLVYRDWFALLNRGNRIAPIGSSDSHEVSRKLVGQGRTYIVCPDDDAGKIDVDKACSNLLAGRTHVSMGLLTMMTVNERFGPGDLAKAGEQLTVDVRVLGPSWTKVNRVMLFGNGRLLKEEEVDEKTASRPGEKWSHRWTLEKPNHDVHLVAVALGPGVEQPYWRIAKPYQPASTKWDSYVIGSTAPIWLDGDEDGRFTCAREYAERLVKAAGGDYKAMVRALEQHDSAVVSQAMYLMEKAGHGASESDVRLIEQGAEHIRSGYQAYVDARKASDAARNVSP